MAQWFTCGYVTPDGRIAERWRITDEYASAFIEWTKRHPSCSLAQFREWMINHLGILVESAC